MQFQMTKTIKFLLIALVGFFLCQQLMDQVLGGAIKSLLALHPSAALHGFIWQFVTYSLLHVDVPHLLLNGLVLAFIGSEIEALWGQRRFLFFYFICVIGAGLLFVFFQSLSSNPMSMQVPLLGASGGIYGLLIAYGILFSERTLLFMMLFPMKAKHFIWVLAGVELLTSLTSGQGAVSSVAHLGGMGIGFVLLWTQSKGIGSGLFSKIKKGASSSSSASRKKSHLRIVKDEEENKNKKTWH